MDHALHQHIEQRLEQQQANRKMLRRLLIVVPLMFAFGYALVPLYKKICDATGINLVTHKQNNKKSLNVQVDLSRTITIEFDANVRGPFKFRPQIRSMQIYPGALVQMNYEVTNDTAQAVSAQAIPSYAPLQASLYVNKLECFCFKQQMLAGRETRQMPVAFVIDPALPKDVKTITLSYTFFKVI